MFWCSHGKQNKCKSGSSISGSSCKICPPVTYQNRDVASGCPAGYFNEFVGAKGMDLCDPCQAGTFGSKRGALCITPSQPAYYHSINAPSVHLPRSWGSKLRFNYKPAPSASSFSPFLSPPKVVESVWTRSSTDSDTTGFIVGNFHGLLFIRLESEEARTNVVVALHDEPCARDQM